MEAHAHQTRYRGPEETAGLTSADTGTDLATVRGLAKVLDEALTIPGTKAKFGLDAVLGLIPGIGDVGSAAIGSYILFIASKLGVPAVVLWRMILNVAIDTVVGLVPFVGDLFDVAFRANARNANLLLKSLADPAGMRRSSRWVVLLVGVAFVTITVGGIIGTFLLIRWIWGVAS